MPHRNASAINVLINGVADPLYKCLSVRRGTGGKRLDRAELFYDLAAAGNTYLFDFHAIENPPVVSVELLPAGGGTPQTIHWGKLSIESLRLSHDEQKLLFTSRTEPFHFGGVLRGQLQWDPVSDEIVQTGVDLVFNPEIDDVVLPNMSQSQTFAWSEDPFSPGVAVVTNVFLDPESVRTPAAISLQNGVGTISWNLTAAARYLLTSLNPRELFFANPDVLDIEAVLGTDPDLITNLKIKRGLYLTEALDLLLEPFGYSWRVTYPGNTIEFFERGVGAPVSVTLDVNALSPATNAAETAVEFNLGNVRNYVYAEGDFVSIEATWVLDRAWPDVLAGVNYDELDPTTDLSKDCDNYNDPSKPLYKRVWRDWVLDTDGSYFGIRPENVGPVDLSDLLSLATAITDRVVPKRRRFHPCLTLGPDGAPIGQLNGVVVEWSDDAGVTWYPLDRLQVSTCHVMQRECGVRFDGQHVPAELYRAGDDAQVRVTATIRFDSRVGAIALNSASSPLQEPAYEYIDGTEKFHLRVVSSESQYAGQVAAGELTAAVADDRVALADFCQQIHDAWDMADVSGEFVIEGLDRQIYDTTNVVTQINGRNISLAASGINAAAARYPQIVGIEYHCQGREQKRVLLLETYREEAD